MHASTGRTLVRHFGTVSTIEEREALSAIFESLAREYFAFTALGSASPVAFLRIIEPLFLAARRDWTLWDAKSFDDR